MYYVHSPCLQAEALNLQRVQKKEAQNFLNRKFFCLHSENYSAASINNVPLFASVTVKVAFPSAVTATVAPGSEYTISIEPNMAWEVSVPEATAAYFQIKSGENMVYTLRGEAGKHDVVI